MPYVTEWLSATVEQGFDVTPMHFVQGMPMVVLTYGLRQGGQTLGILAVLADLTQTYQILTPAHTAEGGYAYVVDAEGRTVLHEYSPFLFSRELHPQVAGIAAALAGQRHLPIPYVGLNREGSQVIGAWAPLQQAPWTVIAEQPIRPVVQGLVPLVVGAVVVFLLSLTGSLVVGLFIARRVVQPIIQLQDGARRIGAGDLEHQIALPGHDELTDLADEFNRMGESLRESLAGQEAWSHELEERVTARTAELSQTLERLQEESRARENLLLLVKEISSPVIPVMAGIIVMPVVGTLDSERAQRVMDDLLAGVEREKARVVILDITGLAMVDTAVANALLQASGAAQLLGAQPILVGVAPEVAETLVHLGVDIHHLRTAATLQEGLQMALAMLRRRVVAV
jgi:anti-anti-sigma regulatory factor/HAMP domain-containing protein